MYQRRQRGRLRPENITMPQGGMLKFLRSFFSGEGKRFNGFEKKLLIADLVFVIYYAALWKLQHLPVWQHGA